MLQKAMKQGRNVHGIPLLDACSDHVLSDSCFSNTMGFNFFGSKYEVIVQ